MGTRLSLILPLTTKVGECLTTQRSFLFFATDIEAGILRRL